MNWLGCWIFKATNLGNRIKQLKSEHETCDTILNLNGSLIKFSVWDKWTFLCKIYASKTKSRSQKISSNQVVHIVWI